MISFNKIVNKLWKKWWKVVLKNDIFEILDPDMDKKNNTKLNKLIYRLKAEQKIVSIRNWVYIVPTEDDLSLNSIDLIEKYYYRLLKRYIRENTWAAYYISWDKSLELHLKNQEIPEVITIVTRDINKKIIIGSYTIVFKTIFSSSVAWQKKINLYSKFKDFCITKDVDWETFKISWLELALLEVSLVTDINNWLNITLLSKVMKKYKWLFDSTVFYKIAKYKYIMSFNRLKELSRNIDNDLSKTFLDIIKVNWGLFIWEWVRGV